MRDLKIKVSEVEIAKTIKPKPKTFKDNAVYQSYKRFNNKDPKLKGDRSLTTADFIREQIRLRCLSYRKLAAITGVNYNIISQACNSELPSQEQFLKMCEPFNYSKKELLEIYEIGLKEALLIRTNREREAYLRIEKIRAGGGLKNKGEDKNGKEK